MGTLRSFAGRCCRASSRRARTSPTLPQTPRRTRTPADTPPPLALYPYWVFSDPGILHRNSGTESRTRALVLAATLKRRDCLCMGGVLGPVSLGLDPLLTAASRGAAGKLDRVRAGPGSAHLPLPGASFARKSNLPSTARQCLIRTGVWAEMTTNPH